MLRLKDRDKGSEVGVGIGLGSGLGLGLRLGGSCLGSGWLSRQIQHTVHIYDNTLLGLGYMGGGYMICDCAYK